MKVLVLEDDEFICEQIKTYFMLNDHYVEIYTDGESLLDECILENFDIFLFDINIPKKNGIEVLNEIRKQGINTPAIFLTALSDIEFVKKGYDAGCNDYVRKPFNLEEVELRIKQLLYKCNDDCIDITSEYCFNMSKMELYHQSKQVELKNTEKQLLYILVKNIGKIVPPQIIKDYVWNEKDVCDNTLRTQIKKIRAKLDTNFIKNIRNSGYKIDRD